MYSLALIIFVVSEKMAFEHFPRGGSCKWRGDASRYYVQKYIVDWCSKDRKILVTPSFFVVRPFLFTSLLIYIYFPTSKKMAIIGTLPSQFSDKN